jgi:hypothetical protein
MPPPAPVMSTILPLNRAAMSGAILLLGRLDASLEPMTERRRSEGAPWGRSGRRGPRRVGVVGDVAPLGRRRDRRALRDGIASMERRDLVGAEAIFGRVIADAPAFAEGWNKRATVRYVAENYEGAIADCEETLTRNRHHFGALSGAGSATWPSAAIARRRRCSGVRSRCTRGSAGAPESGRGARRSCSRQRALAWSCAPQAVAGLGPRRPRRAHKMWDSALWDTDARTGGDPAR